MKHYGSYITHTNPIPEWRLRPVLEGDMQDTFIAEGRAIEPRGVTYIFNEPHTFFPMGPNGPPMERFVSSWSVWA